MGTESPPAENLGEGQPRDLWYVGAIINVIGSIAINLGTNLMKLGHNKRAKLELPDTQKPPVRKFKEWIIGMTFFSIGNILNFVSFGFAAQSLLAALGSIQFVSNVIFAFFVLHEPINRMVLLATACIVGGCVLLVVFGNQSSATYTVKKLTELYTKPAYVVYLSLLGVGVVGGYMLYLQGQKAVKKTGPRGFWYGVLPVAYSVFSALIGTQSVLFSKSMSVILRLTFSGDNQLGNWYTWLVLPLFMGTAVFWITRLNKGLLMFPAMIIVPVMQICWTLFSIVSGMLYFEEYLGFTPLKSTMFPIGVLVVFIGVFLLTQSGASKQASYQKMEEASAAAAIKQDTAKTAFGSQSTDLTDLTPRGSTIDTKRLDGSAVAAEHAVLTVGRPGPAIEGVKEVHESLSEAPSSKPEFGDDIARAAAPASPVRSDSTMEESRVSMMGGVMRRVRNVQDKLNKDLLGVEARAGFRLAMGLGDGGMPAISLFAMPSVLDYTTGNAVGRYSEVSVTSPKETNDGSMGLNPILEDAGRHLDSAAPVGGERQTMPSPQPGMDGSPRTAPGSPRSSLGRALMDRAERVAKSGIEVIKRAPSNLQRAVREKQGYGSLYKDEETGLLEMIEKSDTSIGKQQR